MERATTLNADRCVAEVSKIRWSEVQEGPPDPKKLYGTKYSVGGGTSEAHPAYSWRHGQILGCDQKGVRHSAGPGLCTVTAKLPSGSGRNVPG